MLRGVQLTLASIIMIGVGLGLSSCVEPVVLSTPTPETTEEPAAVQTTRTAEAMAMQTIEEALADKTTELEATETGEASTLTPIQTIAPVGSKWFVRVHNVDDLGRVYVNDEKVVEAEYQRDSGWVDVTEYIIPGQENLIQFFGWNYAEEYAWGFALKRDDTVVWEDRQGEVGFRGANNHDLSKEDEAVYNKVLLIDEADRLSELPGSSTKWFVKLSNIDDMAHAQVNGRSRIIVLHDKGGESDWVDITDWVHDGRENVVRFISWNYRGPASWSMALRRGNEIVWSDEGTMERTEENSLVYDQRIYITRQGEISAVPEKTRWYARVRIADDLSRVSVNGEPFLEMKHEDWEEGWVEITGALKSGQENILRFSNWNGRSGPGQWDFALMRNNGIIWEETGQSEAENQMVYDFLLFITPDGEVTSDSPTPRWFVRASDIDDHVTFYANGEEVFEQAGGTTDWVDVTGEIVAEQENTIRLTNWNDQGPGVWKFALRRNNSIVWEDEGQTGSDKKNQIVYDKTLNLTAAGEVIDP